jgi:hypothetical protein
MPVCRNSCFNPRLKYYIAGDIENDEDAIAILREDNQLQHFSDSRGKPYPENPPAAIDGEQPKKRGRNPAAKDQGGDVRAPHITRLEGAEEEGSEDITPEGAEG